jgi:frataxin
MMNRLVSSSRSVLQSGGKFSPSLARCVSASEGGRMKQPERNTTKDTQGSVRTFSLLTKSLPMPALSSLPNSSQQIRGFKTEAEYNSIADETLDTIQDAVDDALDATSIEYECENAAGVLTLKMPPHGTWVINKQTPNQQIWWSSPLSGPKRFEYEPESGEWFSTKDGLYLGPHLVQELRHVHKQLEEFEIDV